MGQMPNFCRPYSGSDSQFPDQKWACIHLPYLLGFGSGQSVFSRAKKRQKSHGPDCCGRTRTPRMLDDYSHMKMHPKK
jgi:hypothetical protein